MSLISFRRLATAFTSHLATFCHDLESRGLVENSYPSNILKDDYLERLPNVLYAGFDPTAESLHVGNLVVVASLLRAALNNCRSIAIIGGATALIGDPSGKQNDRAELSRDIVEHNASRLMSDLRRFTTNAAEMTSRDLKLDILNNINWYGNMSMIDFLRLSRKFRVGAMLRLGHIKNRMKDDSDFGVNFTEFSYQILQSYDWKVLVDGYDCLFQLGGSDQLGHLDSGYHYIKSTTGKRTAGVCLPLITDAFGNKIGKSSAARGDAVWLNSELTSPYALYQYFRQLHDDSAEKFLPYFSLKSIEEIRAIISDHNQNLGKWVAQTALADEVTEIVHGKSGLILAKQCSNVLFNGSMDDLRKLDLQTILSLFGASTFTLNRSEVLTFGELADRTRTDKVKGSILMTKGAFKMEDSPKIYFFAYSEEAEQIAQLHNYLGEKGAKLRPLSEDRLSNITEVVKGSAILGSNGSEELEEVFNSILSIIIGFSQEEAFQLIQEWGKIVLSEDFKGTGWQSQAGIAVIVFSNLFHFYESDAKMKLFTFKVLLEVAGRARVTEAIDLSQSTINGYFKEWNLTKDEQISVLHILHKALLADGRGRDAAEVMTRLLKTYSDTDASKVEPDAIECVRTAIIDPKTFSFDYLLHIKAVQQLEKSKPDLFKLLKVFSHGTLSDFKEFVKTHPDFIKTQLKFDDQSLLKKIKILTLITLSENLSYETLKKELEIGSDEDLEKFLIDVLQSKAINGKLNGVKKEFSVTAMEQRTFGRKEWQNLRESLANLLENLQRTKKNLDVAADPNQLNGLLHYR